MKAVKQESMDMTLKGIYSDFMAEPFHRFRGPEREQVRDILQELDRVILE